MCAEKLTSSQLNMPHGTEQKRMMKKLKPKKQRTEMLRRNGPVMKSVESVLRAGRESMVASDNQVMQFSSLIAVISEQSAEPNKRSVIRHKAA